MTAATLTGVIESCPGLPLNRNAELKDFLYGGQAEEYEGVTISWISGTSADK
jgi:hypothetical protein